MCPFVGGLGAQVETQAPCSAHCVLETQSLTRQVAPGDFAEGAREQSGRKRRVNCFLCFQPCPLQLFPASFPTVLGPPGPKAATGSSRGLARSCASGREHVQPRVPPDFPAPTDQGSVSGSPRRDRGWSSMYTTLGKMFLFFPPSCGRGDRHQGSSWRRVPTAGRAGRGAHIPKPHVCFVLHPAAPRRSSSHPGPAFRFPGNTCWSS